MTGGLRTGRPFWASPIDLAPYGYVEEEYFLSGTASNRGLGGHGEHTAPYKVRILVRRPADPARFNGTAVLEWFNVSLQSEVEHEWPIDHPMLMRDGYVSAAVSAQFLGVQSASPMSLRNWDPQRYGSLQHPGDDFSYDIFAQAAQALRSGLVVDRLPVGLVLGTGTSQSCLRLVTYISKLAVRRRSLRRLPPDDVPGHRRSPRHAGPPLWGTSEWEAALPSRPDGPLLRVWEIAGTSHADVGGALPGRTGLPRLQLAGRHGAVPGPWDEATAGQYGEQGSSPSNLAPAATPSAPPSPP